MASINSELDEVAAVAADLEAKGADVLAAGEMNHDPIMLMAMAATSTNRAQIMTGISVAFARSPMTLALQAHDVQALSQGRFILGIGSQIRPHIERRYSMTWSKPAARMREYVSALKAIWACWYEDEPLDFRGEFYTHTLMTPMFTPRNKRFGAPPVYVAAVGPVMTRNAAEVADGVLVHSFTTEEYIRSTMLPAMEEGLATSGRKREDLKVVCSPFIITGETEEEFEKVKAATCKQIAFYASTPAYKPILDSIGYGELQPEFLRLSKAGEWLEMARLVDDELLNKVALVGDRETVASQFKQRYKDVADFTGISVTGGDAYSDLGYSESIGSAIKSA